MRAFGYLSFYRRVPEVLSPVVGLVLLMTPTDAVAGPAEPLVKSYAQEVAITFASPAEAAAAELEPLPVYDGRAWALTARWDDNHPGSLTMHDAMAKHGLKGTFYLNDTDPKGRFGEEFVANLMREGFTVGGHTRTHPFLPPLNANELFLEVMANRVEREAQADAPVVSFAFPFGMWESKLDPQAIARITEALRRAGLHHNTYSRFATNNPHARPNEFSTCNLIQPGDSVVDRAKFEINLGKFFSHPAVYQESSHAISLGTHARQSGAGWSELDALFADLVTRADWWMCNQNEYAAYHRQRFWSKIELIDTDGSVARFRITRPIPADCGAVTPLTVAVAGGVVTEVRGASAQHTWRVVDGRTIINLAHNANQTLPQRIDVVDNAQNAPVSLDHHSAKEFPGLHVWLHHDAVSGELLVDLTNTSGKDVRNLDLTLRMPLPYEVGVTRAALDDLGGSEQRQERFALSAKSSDAAYGEGTMYFVAEMDFDWGEERRRLFATTAVRQPPTARACVRDAASMMGPLNLNDSELTQLQDMAKPGEPLANPSDEPNRRWFRATPEDRSRFVGDRLVLFRDDSAWLAATKPFNGQSHAFVASVDFRIERATPVTVVSETPVAHLFLNGERVPATGPLNAVSEGTNRLVIVFDVTDKRTYWKSMPAWFELRSEAGSPTYVLPGE